MWLLYIHMLDKKIFDLWNMDLSSPLLALSVVCLFAIGSHGLTCFNCLNIRHPRFCNHVQTCSSGQSCGIEKVVFPSGEMTFNVGCFRQKTCYDNATDTPHTTCRHCCSSDLCNMAGCGEHGLGDARGPICYDCRGILTSDECRTISVCEENQACYSEDQFIAGEKFSTFSCQHKNVCDAVTNGLIIIGRRSIDIRKRSTICTHCCENNLCNIACRKSEQTESGATLTVTMETTPVVTQPVSFLRDCTDISKSGVYHIYPKGEPGYEVYCDMATDRGGWTVFQRRFDGSVAFKDRLWNEYKNGFGDVHGEHWLGNEKVHEITNSGRYELRVELTDWNNQTVYAVYRPFTIGNETSKYRMSIGNYIGTAGDSLRDSDQQMFTTIDNQNDGRPKEANCAGQQYGRGAWWFSHACGNSQLNAFHASSPSGIERTKGIVWFDFKGWEYSLKATKMMIRRY